MWQCIDYRGDIHLTIVHDDHFKILEGLRQDAFERFAQPIRTVIGRHDYRHHWRSIELRDDGILWMGRRPAASPDLINRHDIQRAKLVRCRGWNKSCLLYTSPSP